MCGHGNRKIESLKKHTNKDHLYNITSDWFDQLISFQMYRKIELKFLWDVINFPYPSKTIIAVYILNFNCKKHVTPELDNNTFC